MIQENDEKKKQTIEENNILKFWVNDTGAEVHVTSDEKLLIDIKDAKMKLLTSGNKEVRATKKGKTIIKLENGSTLVLENVWLAPVAKNIFLVLNK